MVLASAKGMVDVSAAVLSLGIYSVEVDSSVQGISFARSLGNAAEDVLALVRNQGDGGEVAREAKKEREERDDDDSGDGQAKAVKMEVGEVEGGPQEGMVLGAAAAGDVEQGMWMTPQMQHAWETTSTVVLRKRRRDLGESLNREPQP